MGLVRPWVGDTAYMFAPSLTLTPPLPFLSVRRRSSPSLSRSAKKKPQVTSSAQKRAVSPKRDTTMPSGLTRSWMATITALFSPKVCENT